MKSYAVSISVAILAVALSGCYEIDVIEVNSGSISSYIQHNKINGKVRKCEYNHLTTIMNHVQCKEWKKAVTVETKFP